MKKIGYVIITILEVLLIVGAYVVKYFTRKKMGMLRFVVYKNMIWEKEYPIEMWRITGIILLLVLTVIVAIIWLKKWKMISTHMHIMGIVMIILSVFAVYFIVMNSSESLRPYYFMAPMIGVGALLQIIKTGVGLTDKYSS